ncbi:MAG TPA: hypothetical protein VFQ60_02230 [Patescibacteria group bacterium]|nr:hypothetical protein [Patescibacteria group bacterium]
MGEKKKLVRVTIFAHSSIELIGLLTPETERKESLVIERVHYEPVFMAGIYSTTVKNYDLLETLLEEAEDRDLIAFTAPRIREDIDTVPLIQILQSDQAQFRLRTAVLPFLDLKHLREMSEVSGMPLPEFVRKELAQRAKRR